MKPVFSLRTSRAWFGRVSSFNVKMSQTTDTVVQLRNVSVSAFCFPPAGRSLVSEPEVKAHLEVL